MNKYLSTILSVIVLGMSLTSFAQNFTVTSPSTDPYQKLCKPIKAGGSFQMQIKVKSNINETFTISIDKFFSFGTRADWFTIDVNSYTIVKDQTVVFLLTVNVPAGTSENTYYFNPYFNAIKGTSNSPFQGGDFNVIVDNTPPEILDVWISSKTHSSISIDFSSLDTRSMEYTNANGGSGIAGIKSYTLLLKDPNGVIQETKSANATEMSSSYTFKNLAGYTEYTATVTATDLASNSKTSPGLAARTKVAAPANITVTNVGYCNATLSWGAVNGATSYRVSTSAEGTNPITVTSLSLPITGLTAGTRYTYYIAAVGTEGEGPRVSASFSTLAVPTPTFTATNLSMCSNDKTIEVNAIPFIDSYTWTISSPLTINGAQSYTTTNTSVVVHADVLQGQGTISVVANLSCGIQSFITSQQFQLGIPTPKITSKLNSATGEPAEFRYTATPYSGAQYSWYVNDVINQTGLDNTFDWYFPCRVTKTIKCKLTNTCGTSGFSNSSTRTGGCDRPPKFSISPNPAHTTVAISAINSNMNIDSNSSEASFDYVKVYDLQGNLKKNLTRSKARSASINLDNLKEGTYIFEIGNSNYSEKHQIIIRK